MSQRSDVAAAYAACEALARSHYENFPVASRLLPRAMRPHVAAVYAFARTADDIADEGVAAGADRRDRLAVWQHQLHEAVAGGAASAQLPDADPRVITATAQSIRTLDLPLELFDDLVSAFRQDTMVTRYASWTDVLDYCRRSANPIGRLVLRIAGYGDAALDRSSDALCTALQLTNFWQDFGRDWRAGRLYVPREVSDAHGATEADLAGGRLTDAWASALGECVSVTRERFEAGRAVCHGVGGRLRVELRMTWLGGGRILTRVDRGRRRLLEVRPRLVARDVPGLLWSAVRWKTHPPVEPDGRSA